MWEGARDAKKLVPHSLGVNHENVDAPCRRLSVQRVLTQLTIAGMRSVHSVRAIYTALTAVDGITHAEVRLGSADITHDGRATCAALSKAIELAGYQVESCEENRRRLT